MSYVTIVSLVILLVCLIVGLIKGAMQALLKLIAAVGTSLLTILVTPYLAKALYSTSFVQNKNIHAGIVSGVSAVLIVLVCLIVFSTISFVINRRISQSALNVVNRLSGAALYTIFGFIVLILIGYVINIFSDVEFLQSLVADTKKDPFANWLVTNNLFNKFMEAVAKEGGVFRQFLDGFKQLSTSDSAALLQSAFTL